MVSVLVTGFGPFPGVDDNPSARLARAVDGVRVRGHTVVARVLPVGWERGPAEAIATARGIGATLVLGLGVATRRDRVDVERVAVRGCEPIPDVDGRSRFELVGPEQVEATIDVARLAGALRAGISEDAGRYVCNAWLYQVALALPLPVGFVHVPPAGMDPDLLLRGIEALLVQ